jgi:hypothetical protein
MAERDEKPVIITEDVATQKSNPAQEADSVQFGFNAELSNLPKGYYRSRFFIGSYLAIGFGVWAGVGALYVPWLASV